MKHIFDLMHISERLKTELRHSWLSNGRQESVAEHTWRMSLMLLLLEPYLTQKINFERAIKILIVHDLVEIYAGDVPLTVHLGDKEIKRQKNQRELEAIQKISADLGGALGEDIKSLWQEYEDNTTYEAKVVKAIDKLEAQLQHNQSDLSAWEELEFALTFRLGNYTGFDTALESLKDLIVNQTIDLYRQHDIDPEPHRQKAKAL